MLATLSFGMHAPRRNVLTCLFYLQANHRDMGEHRLVPKEEAVAFIEHLERYIKNII